MVGEVPTLDISPLEISPRTLPQRPAPAYVMRACFFVFLTPSLSHTLLGQGMYLRSYIVTAPASAGLNTVMHPPPQKL